MSLTILNFTGRQTDLQRTVRFPWRKPSSFSSGKVIW